MTSHRLAGIARGALSAAAALALAAGAALALATPASAHTPKGDAYCEDEATTFTIKLVKYNDSVTNSLLVIVDEDIENPLVDEEDFGTTFEQTWTDFDPTVPHVFDVVVLAGDDEDGSEGWSLETSIEVEACKTAVPTTSGTPTSSAVPPTSEVAPTSEAVPTTAPAGGSSGGLAETGASIAIPVVLGLVMLAGGGALLLLVRRRGGNSA